MYEKYIILKAKLELTAEKSILELENGLKKIPNSMTIKMQLSELYSSIGKMEEACKLLETNNKY